MSKTVDVNLRIRAQNLSGKTLDEINAQVEKLTENQKEQASASSLAARSMRELVDEQKQLAAASRELARRKDQLNVFKEQRTQIAATAESLKDLTARYREMAKGSGGSLIGFTDKDLKSTGTEIVRMQSQLDKLVAKNDRLGTSLQKVGVDTRNFGAAQSAIDASLGKSSSAYAGTVAAIENYGAAVARTNSIVAEAASRRAAETAQIERNIAAARSQAAEQTRIQAARQDAIAAFSAETGAQERAISVSAEVARRKAEETAQIERNAAAIRREASEQARIRQARLDAIAAFGAEFGAAERSNDVKTRLIALLNTERGQRVLAAEAARRQATELNQNSAAVTKNEAATRRAASGLQLFDDVGRKSLGTYQRIRGQILSLTAGYIGVFQAVSTFQKAIAATTRNQSLNIGLKTINSGDTKAAAEDLAFLRKEADRLGLVFDDIAPKFANIAIGAKAIGQTKSQIKGSFSELLTIGAALNLNVEQMDRLNVAVTQIFSKGKVQAEELSGQLGDVLPGAVAKFAEANGIAITKLAKHLKDGKASIAEFTTFLSAYARQFDGEMNNIGNRLQANINRATNAYNDFLRSLLTGSNDKRLSEAFARITSFFKSEDGQKFSDSLVVAIGKAIDAFIFLANNADTVLKILKLFLALQVVKFMADIGFSTLNAAKGLRDMATALIAARAATTAATASSAALTTQTRLLGLAFGPVGAAIAAVSAVIFSYINNIDQATSRTEDYLKVLLKLGKARTSEESFQNIAAATKELEKTKSEIKEIDDILERGGRTISQEFNALIGKGDQATTSFTRSGVEEDRQKLAARALELEKGITEEKIRQEILASSEAVSAGKALADEEAAIKASKAALKAGAADDDKKKKGKTAKTLMAEENARENAERAIQKKILDLDQEIFDARMSGENRTINEINQNYTLRIRQIEALIDEKNLEINALEQKAKTAGTLPQNQAGLGDARKRVEDLKLALNTRAMEESRIAEIALKEKQINDLLDQRNSKIALIAAQTQTGALTDLEARKQTIVAQEEYNAQINQLTTDTLAFLAAITPEDSLYEKLGIANTILGLQKIQAETQKLSFLQKLSNKYGEQIAGGFSTAFGVLAKGFAGALQGANSLGDAFKGAMDSFREFAADFLVQIGQMILQAIILQAIQNAISGGSGGYFTAVKSAFTQHTGGITGRNNAVRSNVPAALFAGAQRFHTGGVIPGLKPNEVPIIAERGEEMLTEDNPRHINNVGTSSNASTPQNIMVINQVDSGSVVQQGVAATPGSKAIYNFIRAHKASFKMALND